MKRSSMTSRSGSLVCPFCETAELERTDSYSAQCISCGRVASLLYLETLHQIITLPEVLGAHTCECGHPEMLGWNLRVASSPGAGIRVELRVPLDGRLQGPSEGSS